MNSNEILQRFAQLDGYALLKDIEAVVDPQSARIVFRQTSAAVRSGRGCIGTLVMILGLGEIVMISTSIPGFAWLLIPFATIGFWGVKWSQKHSVSDDEKTVDFEIDTRTQTIPLLERYRSEKHTALQITEIRDFYVWPETGEGAAYSLRCTYGKNEEMIVLRGDNEAVIEQYARLLGFLCSKSVLKKVSDGKISPLKIDDGHLPLRQP